MVGEGAEGLGNFLVGLYSLGVGLLAEEVRQCGGSLAEEGFEAAHIGADHGEGWDL